MIQVDSHLHIPWIHMNEFCFCFQSLYIGCSRSHDPVPRWHFLMAMLWLVDGSEGVSHFLYFSITCVQHSHTTYGKHVHTTGNAVGKIGGLDCKVCWIEQVLVIKIPTIDILWACQQDFTVNNNIVYITSEKEELLIHTWWASGKALSCTVSHVRTKQVECTLNLMIEHDLWHTNDHYQ